METAPHRTPIQNIPEGRQKLTKRTKLEPRSGSFRGKSFGLLPHAVRVAASLAVAQATVPATSGFADTKAAPQRTGAISAFVLFVIFCRLSASVFCRFWVNSAAEPGNLAPWTSHPTRLSERTRQRQRRLHPPALRQPRRRYRAQGRPDARDRRRRARRGTHACDDREAVPSHGVLGEEFGNDRADAEFVWVLDPIDGTKSFASACPLFGTLIALLHNGQPILGCIHQPVLRQLVVGDCATTTLNGQPVRLREPANLAAATLLVTDTLDVAKHQNTAGWDTLTKRVRMVRTWGDCYGYFSSPPAGRTS
jgi:hypothetical protein